MAFLLLPLGIVITGFAVILFGEASLAQGIPVEIGDGSVRTVSVPGPIVGAGLPGLLLIGAYWLGHKLWNKRSNLGA